MGELITLAKYRNDNWSEIFVVDNEHSTLQVYLDGNSGDVELVQMTYANDSVEAIRSTLTAQQVSDLMSAITARQKK